MASNDWMYQPGGPLYFPSIYTQAQQAQQQQAAAPQVTYTPNGVPRQPGYYNAENPYDTGRHGEQNRELNQGRGGKLNGWDYDTGKPASGVTLGNDGLYQLGGGGGGGGGGGIPNMGIYRQYQTEAKLAYDQALARIKQQRGTLMQQYGFTADVNDKSGTFENVRLDPYNQFGQVRTMLNRQALSLDDVRNQAIGRHITGGLARQGERGLRYLHGAESQALGSQFSQGMYELLGLQQDAEARYRRALLDAELEALRNAIANGLWSGGGGSGGGSSGGSSQLFVGDNTLRVADEDALGRAWAAQLGLPYKGDSSAVQTETDRFRRKSGNVF